MQDKSICIIPARGGSKRIPRKNIKEFCGKPIIAYSIEVALKSRLFDEVMVSTDDEEIAEIAKSYGANVPFMRSANTSDDYATTAEVLLEVLEKYQTLYNKTYEIGCCIYACAPLIKQTKLIKSYQKLVSEGLDSVFPVAEYSTPIRRAISLNDKDQVSFIFKENELVRSQDLKTAYFDTGQYYWFNTQAFKKNKRLISSNSKAIILSALQAQDIDNEEDWVLAELKFQISN